MGLTRGLRIIGCQDKFRHIVKNKKEKNVIGSARIACLCLKSVIVFCSVKWTKRLLRDGPLEK